MDYPIIVVWFLLALTVAVPLLIIIIDRSSNRIFLSVILFMLGAIWVFAFALSDNIQLDTGSTDTTVLPYRLANTTESGGGSVCTVVLAVTTCILSNSVTAYSYDNYTIVQTQSDPVLFPLNNDDETWGMTKIFIILIGIAIVMLGAFNERGRRS